jgi:hypothetical protein
MWNIIRGGFPFKISYRFSCGLNEISGGFSSVVEAAIYKGGSDNRQTSFREP